jgi:DNA-binding transcriptional MerR regulator
VSLERPDAPHSAAGLKMSELAERSGVSAGTIKHYLREGLLGEGTDIVRTSRNMAYYPADYVGRIQLIKRLQEERFMPLRVIKDEILERAVEQREGERISASEVRRRYDIPRNVLDRLAEIGVLTPTARGYDADDAKIIEAIARFRAGGYDERLGFTVFDTLRYRDALAPLVVEEVRTLLDRLAGEVEVERAVEIIAAGAEPLRELIGAMHSKLLLAELRRQRAGR